MPHSTASFLTGTTGLFLVGKDAPRGSERSGEKLPDGGDRSYIRPLVLQSEQITRKTRTSYVSFQPPHRNEISCSNVAQICKYLRRARSRCSQLAVVTHSIFGPSTFSLPQRQYFLISSAAEPRGSPLNLPLIRRPPFTAWPQIVPMRRSPVRLCQSSSAFLPS